MLVLIVAMAEGVAAEPFVAYCPSSDHSGCLPIIDRQRCHGRFIPSSLAGTTLLPVFSGNKPVNLGSCGGLHFRATVAKSIILTVVSVDRLIILEYKNCLESVISSPVPPVPSGSSVSKG
jgi:hypothetical protein